MNAIHLRCCDNSPNFEIEYEIGTTYLVCSTCSEKKHFARGIKLKNNVDKNLQTTLSKKISLHKRGQ